MLIGADARGTSGLKREIKARNKARKDYGNICWTCGSSQTVHPNLKLMACSKCRAIGRKIWYCSKSISLLVFASTV